MGLLCLSVVMDSNHLLNRVVIVHNSFDRNGQLVCNLGPASVILRSVHEKEHYLEIPYSNSKSLGPTTTMQPLTAPLLQVVTQRSLLDVALCFCEFCAYYTIVLVPPRSHATMHHVTSP